MPYGLNSPMVQAILRNREKRVTPQALADQVAMPSEMRYPAGYPVERPDMMTHPYVEPPAREMPTQGDPYYMESWGRGGSETGVQGWLERQIDDPMTKLAGLDLFRGWGSGAGSAIMGAGVPVGRAAKSAVGARTQLLPDNAVRSLVKRTKEQGGSTTNLLNRQAPDTGLMVGYFPGKEQVLDDLTPGALRKYIAKNRATLEKEQNFLGSWIDPESGKVYLDVSRRFEPTDLRKAVKAGESKNQLAIFDLGNMNEIVGGKWDDFVQSDVFRARLHEMSQKGKAYMRLHPNEDWWSLKGSTIEEVYGDNLGAFSGYAAATSPNNMVRQNTADATEYMRRQIAGEPAVQPDYRKPATAHHPGSKMSMEAGKRKNLERVAAGNPEELQQDKVRSMYQAMMGDEDAVVLDRFYARAAEHPLGDNPVFTDPIEGRFPPGEPYQLVKGIVQEEAAKVGETANKFSADAWAGMRETIRNEGQLFGVPRQLSGESKAMSDHFDDLLAETAERLKMTVGQAKDRLKKGDLSLISILLATPLGMAVYSAGGQDDGSM